MDAFHTGFDWLDRLMPDGIALRTATVISGPGGTGKPIIGHAFASGWLRSGGSVVFMPLQFPDTQFVYSGLAAVGGISLDEYPGRVAFVTLDPTIAGLEEQRRGFKANLVKPQVWSEAIERGCALVSGDGPGVLVIGSALNLLLFSPGYGSAILDQMKRTFREDRQRTYLFSISTSAKRKEAAELEQSADNLLMTRSGRKSISDLYLRVVRLAQGRFLPDEVPVPVPPELVMRRQ